MLRDLNVRREAYPFDWILTLDSEKFLLILEEDFRNFLMSHFLVNVPPFSVVNSYYNIEFRHDWSAPIEEQLFEISEKYNRRIKRFYSLNEREEKVFFIRVAFDEDFDPTYQLTTRTAECGRISSEQARKLRDLLLRKFPDLDFTLVILNYTGSGLTPITNLHRVIEFRIDKKNKIEDYKKCLETLKNIEKA